MDRARVLLRRGRCVPLIGGPPDQQRDQDELDEGQYEAPDENLAAHILVRRAGPEINQQEEEERGREDEGEDRPPPCEGTDLSEEGGVALAGLAVVAVVVIIVGWCRGWTLWRRRDGRLVNSAGLGCRASLNG